MVHRPRVPPLHAASRVHDPPSGLALRLPLLAAVLLFLAEGLCRALASGTVDPAVLGPLTSPVLQILDSYWRARTRTVTNPWTSLLGALGVLGFGLLTIRQGVLTWSRLKARVTGTAFREAT